MRRLERLTVLMYVKCAVQTLSMKQGSWCSLMASKHLNASHQPSRPCSSIQNVHCLLQLLSGSSLSTEVPTFQMQVNGAGNRMPEPRHGCHIGPVYQMPAMNAHCYCTACKGNWSAIELEFTVGHCASVKEIAQTMIWNLISTKDSIYIAELYSFLTNVCWTLWI